MYKGKLYTGLHFGRDFSPSLFVLAVEQQSWNFTFISPWLDHLTQALATIFQSSPPSHLRVELITVKACPPGKPSPTHPFSLCRNRCCWSEGLHLATSPSPILLALPQLMSLSWDSKNHPTRKKLATDQVLGDIKRMESGELACSQKTYVISEGKVGTDTQPGEDCQEMPHSISERSECVRHYVRLPLTSGRDQLRPLWP